MSGRDSDNRKIVVWDSGKQENDKLFLKGVPRILSHWYAEDLHYLERNVRTWLVAQGAWFATQDFCHTDGSGID